MDHYHFTDTLGQAVDEARAAAEKANGLFGLLDQELAAERESHRHETLRLVERAEAAELERDQLERALAVVSAERDDAEARAERLDAQLVRLRSDYRQAQQEIAELVTELAQH